MDEIQLFLYDLLIINVISSSRQDGLKKLNEPDMAPAP